ncbi:MAG: gliding motility-associated C-terminal domain-containing protein [Bacteroidales bacterium]|nr:gliding motility-associated C-terminal domain-containing protein [Bacteroidales bacterium]MCF8338032.1 gliding motility-associated C-terminal domain-containing protein [Bacteroidales bacterium]
MQDALSIEVFPLPEVETTPDTAVYSGQQVVLTASGGESYEWNTTPPSQGPTLTVTPKDTVIYTVEVTNKYGCTKIDSIKVKLKDAQAPQVNAFTPNGDGTNDIFLEGYHIKVFNRWGKVLYEGKDGWDGTYNGKPVPAGTYYYIRTTNNAGEEIKVVKGDVTVVRRNE